MMENGHNPEENQVSRTSSSCSRVNLAPPASFLARSSASCTFRPTTQFFPSFAWKNDVRCVTAECRDTYILLLPFNADKVRWAAMSPPKLTGDAPILYVLQPPIPFCLRLFRCNVQFTSFGALEHSKLDRSLLDSLLAHFDRLLSQRLAAYPPLRFEQGFDDITGFTGASLTYE